MTPEDLDNYLNSIGFRFRRLYLDIGKLILQGGIFSSLWIRWNGSSLHCDKEEIHCCLRTAQEVTLSLTEWLSQWATFYFGTYKKTLQSHSRHLWDIDNSFDNWKPEVVTIIVTWQLRVTLDIIRIFRKSKILKKTYLQCENADDFKDKLLQFKAVREAPNNNKTGNLGTIDPNLWNHPPS